MGSRRPSLSTLGLLLAATQADASGFWKPFLAGVGTGFAVHETSHLALDIAFDADPRLKGVKFGPLPFFAITHRGGVAAGKEALISGAGFFSQHVFSEVILTRRGSDAEVSSFGKGVLSFHAATSLAYAGAALARYGPFERDTRGLAQATATDERVVGLFVLAPAVFDSWRYYRPGSRFAKWGSRISKVGFAMFLVFKE